MQGPWLLVLVLPRLVSPSRPPPGTQAPDGGWSKTASATQHSTKGHRQHVRAPPQLQHATSLQTAAHINPCIGHMHFQPTAVPLMSLEYLLQSLSSSKVLLCKRWGVQWWPPSLLHKGCCTSLPSLCQCCSRLLGHFRVTVVEVEPQHLAPHGLLTRILPAKEVAIQRHSHSYEAHGHKKTQHT